MATLTLSSYKSSTVLHNMQNVPEQMENTVLRFDDGRWLTQDLNTATSKENESSVVVDEDDTADTWQPQTLRAGIVLSVEEHNGVLTTVYIAPCDTEELHRINTQLVADLNESTDAGLVRRKEHLPKTVIFRCPVCGNSIRNAGPYKMHLRACQRDRNEQSMGPKCEICDKSFSSQCAMQRHMQIHTKEAIYKCVKCKRRFKDEQKYKAHVRQHKYQANLNVLSDSNGQDPVAMQKQFSCLFCKQSFTVMMKVGEKKTRYACDECRSFHRAAEEMRRRGPAQKKPDLPCERCGRAYKLEGFLMRHLAKCDGTVKRKSHRTAQLTDLMRI